MMHAVDTGYRALIGVLVNSTEREMVWMGIPIESGCMMSADLAICLDGVTRGWRRHWN
jgi:tetrahydromethanopterin S-methyltransferase subunit C